MNLWACCVQLFGSPHENVFIICANDFDSRILIFLSKIQAQWHVGPVRRFQVVFCVLHLLSSKTCTSASLALTVCVWIPASPPLTSGIHWKKKFFQFTWLDCVHWSHMIRMVPSSEELVIKPMYWNQIRSFEKFMFMLHVIFQLSLYNLNA